MKDRTEAKPDSEFTAKNTIVRLYGRNFIAPSLLSDDLGAMNGDPTLISM